MCEIWSTNRSAKRVLDTNYLAAGADRVVGHSCGYESTSVVRGWAVVRVAHSQALLPLKCPLVESDTVD